MLEQNIFHSLFVTFAFISQVLLIFNFAALKWRPHLQQQWGWLVYAAALVALPLGILYWVTDQAWYFWLAFAMYTIWATLGYIVDILRPIDWRVPILWKIFIPYLLLYLASQFAFWIPLWFIGIGYWRIYAVLYTINTGLNISTHFRQEKIIPR